MTVNSKRCLFLTNHMTDLTGSSIVVLELATELLSRGMIVEVACLKLSDPLKSILDSSDIKAFVVDGTIDPTRYDLIWCQHIMFGWVELERFLGRQIDVKIVFMHLGPTEFLELPTYGLEAKIADAVLCNSSETLAAVERVLGDDATLVNFRNGAPESFFAARRPRTEFKRVLCVSNHHVPEIDEAMTQLRDKGVHVEFVGVFTGNYRQIVPFDLAWADVVVTIGKTAVYGLAAGTLIYVYGPHGGYGYLTASDFDEVAAHNFSGRPSRTMKKGAEIASELMDGFTAALAAQNNWHENGVLGSFRLRDTIDELMRSLGGEKHSMLMTKEMLSNHLTYRNVCQAWRRSLV